MPIIKPYNNLILQTEKISSISPINMDYKIAERKNGGVYMYQVKSYHISLFHSLMVLVSKEQELILCLINIVYIV